MQNLPGRIPDRGQWQDWRRDHLRDLVSYWNNHGGEFGDWFDYLWWQRNKVEDPYYSGFNYWEWAAWASLNSWMNSPWDNTIYYNYGDNVYYQDGSVYYGDQAVATEDEYAQQAEAIATSVPDAEPAEKDWMPLGVFAITSDGEPTGAEPTMFLQLAVSKQGVINGTLQNIATDSVQEIEGMVDKQTQRAAWTAVGKSRPLMETGIVNLTEDATPALVHFPDDSTQQLLLVRLKKPETNEASAPAKNGTE